MGMPNAGGATATKCMLKSFRPMRLKHDIKLDIATAPSCRSARWKNTRTTWGELATTLAQTKRTEESVNDYSRMSKDKQGAIKDVGGFVGGYLRDGKRHKESVEFRQVVTLDVDFGADGFGQWDSFALLGFAGCMYTTHKHSPGSSRYRIVFPVDRRVGPDEYEAIARVVASWLGIDNFDDTTYQPVRLMYYPSTSLDGEFVFDLIDAPPICADLVLGELPDWRDPTTWPSSSRVKEAITHARADKAETPSTKEGFVGAFCRAYTITAAIAEFLPEVYTESEHADRYDFVGGSTSGGLVIYADEHAFSHHATDPAGGQLLNAFDLVRLHRFAELDEGKREGTPVNRLPSYKAMTDLAAGLPAIKKDIAAERRAKAADDYGDSPEGPSPKEGANKRPKGGEAKDADMWLGTVELDKNGAFKNTIDNVVKIVTNDANLCGRYGFNEFEQREVATRALPWDRVGLKYPRPLVDSDDAELRLYLERCYGIVSKAAITDGLTVAVRAHSFHPVKDYLATCEWDGVERLDTLLVDMFAAEDSPYIRAVTRKSFTAAVARILTPGCKFDYVLILSGAEGIRKSTLLDRMGGSWFSDSMPSVTGKEALEQVQGAWIIELGELAGLRRAEVEGVKHFISKREDRYRVAYGKRAECFPRRCVFFGTTNESDFLRSATGNRRFWVVDCLATQPIDYDLSAKRVSLLWGEAKHRFEEGERLYLSAYLEQEAREIQDDHLERDDRSGLIGEFLERLLPEDWNKRDIFSRREWLNGKDNEGKVERKSVCAAEIWAECLGRDINMITRRDSLEIVRAMKAFKDWKLGTARRSKNYGLQKEYAKTTASAR